MTSSDFIEQLKELHYLAEDLGNNRIRFQYKIPVGKFKGRQIMIGLDIPPDFPLTPPSGPHISPQLLPINKTGSPHPAGAVHESPFGLDWEYWSRPFPGWPGTDRRVRTYMAHLTNLFATQ